MPTLGREVKEIAIRKNHKNEANNLPNDHIQKQDVDFICNNVEILLVTGSSRSIAITNILTLSAYKIALFRNFTTLVASK